MWSNRGRSRKASRANSFSPQPLSGVSSLSIVARMPLATATTAGARVVAAGLAVAGDEGGAALGLGHRLQQGDHRRDVRRVVLAVAVEGGDEGGAGVAHAGGDRLALAAAGGVRNTRSHGREPIASRRIAGARVVAPVVDVDHLEAGDGAERGLDLVDQGHDVLRLVLDRHDDRRIAGAGLAAVPGWIGGLSGIDMVLPAGLRRRRPRCRPSTSERWRCHPGSSRRRTRSVSTAPPPWWTGAVSTTGARAGGSVRSGA